MFYTNPPWGQNNNGESVIVFTQRGMEAVGYDGQGLVVIADDAELEWPQKVLWSTQVFATSNSFYVSRMMPKEHVYHLFDEHSQLPSCNLLLSSLPGSSRRFQSEALAPDRLENFYGRSKELRVRYIKELARPDYGKATQSEYELIPLEDKA